MLKVCAPGATVRLATHSRVIQYKDKTYRSLPKFDRIELGHIRKMSRVLEILECAKRQIPGL
ncbi:MAG TPA: hypothetical protein VN682_11165 [Terriglobales bacterium]|nr:hypothetical protein [Terriglobales bacterium]